MRELTFAERKVNFKKIDKFQKMLSYLLDEKIKIFIPILAQKKETEKDIAKLVNIVTLIQKESFELWKKTASQEMNLKTIPTNKKIIDKFKEDNKKIIEKMIIDIRERFKEKWFSENWIVTQFLNWLKTLFVYASINLWRETIFETNKELIYAFEYSAILDNRTSDICKKLDWIIIWRDDEAKRKKYNPPNHWNCRSIWVEILEEEDYKPKINI